MKKHLFVLSLIALLSLPFATAAEICYQNVADIPAVCNGGDITKDKNSGCRVIECSSDASFLKVLACDKPGSYNAKFFEMYKLQAVGGDLEVCIGDACIANNGYARSDFPYCFDDGIVIDLPGDDPDDSYDDPKDKPGDTPTDYSCEDPLVLDFEEFPAGTVLDTELSGNGITISAENHNPNPGHPDVALVFDSSNPTGDDRDLGTPHFSHGGPGIGVGNGNDEPLGNLIIIAENTDYSDPDDEWKGGAITFSFSMPYILEELTVVDTEEGGSAVGKSGGSTVLIKNLPEVGNNDVATLDLDSVEVDELIVTLTGSGATDRYVLCPVDEEPFCGDGNLDHGEECDDGNNVDGDGCSSTCEYEPFCGDGTLDDGEQCDDGNNVDGDGCSSTCEYEPFCGDGTLDDGEQCDDGNNVDGDGCSSTCELEAGNCEEAVEAGLLKGRIMDGMATVVNNANEPYTVSLAVYEMFAPLIEDQLLYDAHTKTVQPGEEFKFSVELPNCRYQMDLVCGEPLQRAPFYDLLIDSEFGPMDDVFCTPHENPASDAEVTVEIAPWFPQDTSYVFICETDDFVPTEYYWYFGDGDIQPASTQMDVWHTYQEAGTYTVACSATDGVDWQTGTLEIVVE